MHIKVLKAHQYAIVVCKTGGCVSGDTSCGVHCVDTKENYIEILRFKQFHDHFVFIDDEHNFKKKVLKKYFNVSVVVNLECGDTKR